MKSIQIFICLIFLAGNVVAQSDSTAHFPVQGLCGMCKQRIERGILGKGVKYANWNVDSKILTVVYKTAKINLQGVHERVAALGHDTELVKADNKVYDKLHGCCKYRTE
ncbi:MAG: hypothetical protein RL329_3034 [Bacteroidota bacterium]|jgi:hypothetical protein